MSVPFSFFVTLFLVYCVGRFVAFLIQSPVYKHVCSVADPDPFGSEPFVRVKNHKLDHDPDRIRILADVIENNRKYDPFYSQN